MRACALIAAFISASAIGAHSTATAGFDRATLMAEAVNEGFEATEEKYLAAASTGEAAAVVALARFYMAHELWVEACAALERLGEERDKTARALEAECDYRMGRYERVIALAGAPGANNPLAAMALVRLGAYDEARDAFEKAPPIDGSTNLRSDYFLSRAEALIETGATDDAEAALKAAGDSRSESRRRFLQARIHLARGDALKAAGAFRSAAASGADEWSMRARVAIAEREREIGVIEALSLEWRGGAFERDMQMALGRLRLDGADYDRGFRALKIVVDRFPRSDDAIAAQDAIAAMLPTLFADESGLHPKDAARLFFENVEFAPPGHEGDRLIHEVSSKLEALGLYEQAAQLLDHQVFRRLRGAERSIVAADLADLHLLARNPAEALRVLRSTRIAGLSEKDVQRRRRLEAKALAANGEADRALALLSAAPTAGDLLLRAEINWARRAWPDAAADYSSYVAGTRALTSNEDRTAAVRAATAFLLAGDRAGYRAFAMEASLRLEGSAEADLIRTMGDVDREQFLANFMSSYRSVYGREGS